MTDCDGLNGMPDSALQGVRVIEISGHEGAYCARLLADLGAEVVRLEPEGGDGLRRLGPFPPGMAAGGYLDRYLNAGKRNATLDLKTHAGREALLELARGVDLLVETLPPGRLAALGLPWERLHAANPALVLTSITAFGQTGPHRDYPPADIVAMAMGGAMTVIGDPRDPPVVLAGSQSFVVASTLAAVSSLIALRHVAAGGVGQHIDISMQEAMLAASSICGIGKWLDDGLVPKRFGTATFSSVPSGTYTCADGEIYLMVNRPLHWKALARWVHETTGNEEILDPMFEGPSLVRQPYRELIDIFLGEHMARFTVDELYREAQERHLAMTPLNSLRALGQDRHLRARGFFVDVPQCDGGTLRFPGPPYRFSKTPARVERGAPLPGSGEATLKRWRSCEPRSFPSRADEPGDGPLAGLRVVEFTAGMAGPWIGRFLAWCGADVIKIESKAFPDVTRLYIPPREPERGIQSQMSPWFTDWNGGKRFVSLDLVDPRGAELARRLVAKSDVVIDNNSTGVLDKLGLGFDVLEKLKPELVLFSSTGYGDSGPDQHYVSWGPNIETLSGIGTVSGFPHRSCTMTQFAYPDPLSALYGMVAVLAALHHRDASGQGQRIDLAQLEATIASIGPLVLEALAEDREPPRLGNAARTHAPQGCYPCLGEDRWCVIAVTDQAAWERFCIVTGNADWRFDPRFSSVASRLANAAELDRLISAWTASRDRYEVMHQLARAGIAAGVVQDVEDQLERDAHLAERGYFERIFHHAKGMVLAPGIPLGLTGTPGRTRDAGHARGHDNEDVFQGLLGLSTQEYAAAIAAGVIEVENEVS